MIFTIVLILTLIIFSQLIHKKIPSVPPILYLILLGFIFGEHSLNLMDHKTLESFSEIGIIFLMFFIGLHIDLSELKHMKKYIFGLGSLQVLITSSIFLLFFSIIEFLGNGIINIYSSIFFAIIISLSSSAIIIEKIIENNLSNTSIGKAKLGILIFQDLISPFLLTIISIYLLLIKDSQNMDFITIAILILKIFLYLIGSIFLIIYIFKPIFLKILNSLYKLSEKEYKTLFWILLPFFPALFLTSLGLSAGIGALILGLIINEDKLKKEAIENTSSYKKISLGIFFIYIGSIINGEIFMKYFFLILLIVLSIKIIKFIGTYISCRILNINPKDSLRIGINLSQISEFSLIIISVLFQNRLLGEKEYQIFTIIIVLSMIFSIFIMKYTMKKNIIFPKKKDLI